MKFRFAEAAATQWITWIIIPKKKIILNLIIYFKAQYIIAPSATQLFLTRMPFYQHFTILLTYMSSHTIKKKIYERK